MDYAQWGCGMGGQWGCGMSGKGGRGVRGGSENGHSPAIATRPATLALARRRLRDALAVA